ncbi:unnamed protein product [Euphydryas editha]|uniref:Uncharacterized protein n=1 Tax=Euphydryas editha TaxID=104508 RepID=A0AAU9UXB7_EUPED|nr:unnamed protein product [Euphydryas editha]
MELKSPKAKKKSPIAWKKMFRTPALLLLLLGSINCDIDSDLNLEYSNSSYRQSDFKLRHRHVFNESYIDKQVLSDIKYLRRHLNRAIVNFVMTDVLVDGEVENRIHYDGVTAKETYVGADG